LRGVASAGVLIAVAAGLVLAFEVGAAGGSTTGTTSSQPSPPQAWNAPGFQAAVAQAQQAEAARVTGLSSPSSVAARLASQTAYANETPTAALAAAKQAFPGPVAGPGDRPLGSGPARRISDGEAAVQGAGGKWSLAVGAGPVFGKDAAGHEKPVDLALADQGGSFAPQVAAVPVSIPKSSNSPLVFDGSGIAVHFGSGAGVAAQQSAGAVYYANIGQDTDAAIRPVPVGAEVSFVLRSAASPSSQTLAFDLPAGWKLFDLHDGSGVIQVLSADSSVQAMIAPVLATDAQGSVVPAHYTVVDETHLEVTVDDQGGSYAFPILVDPVVNAYTGGQVGTNFFKYSTPGAALYSYTGTGTGGGSYGNSYGEWYGLPNTAYGSGVGGEFYTYAWSGAYVYRFDTDATWHQLDSSAEYGGILAAGGGWESGNWADSTGHSGTPAYRAWGYAETGQNVTYCARANCPFGVAANITAGNSVYFGLYISGTTGGVVPVAALYSAVLFEGDNYAPTITSVQHSGYTPGTWVKSAVDNVTVNSSVAGGLGIADTTANGATDSTTCNATTGVCPTSQAAGFTIYTSTLPERANTVTAQVDGAGGNSVTSTWNVDVDRSAPALAPSGSLWNPNATLAQSGSYQLNVTATDGNGLVPVSGVSSLAISVDGTAISGLSYTPCGPGSNQCSSSTSWTMNTAQYAQGPHTITITATDHAGNVATSSETVEIHQAAQESIGPGNVNVESGEFGLSATDVSVSGFGSRLDISRSFESQHLPTARGPFGPGWTASLPQGSAAGAFQRLSIAGDDKSAVLTNTAGQQSVWPRNADGTYQTPTGMEGVTLNAPGNAGNPAEYAPPSASSAPGQVAVGPDGKLWFTEFSADRIGQLTPCTTSGCTPQITEYSNGITAGGEPFGIAAGPDGNLWFTEYGKDKIGKITPSGQVNEYPLTAGSVPAEITVGPDNNLWFVENGRGRIGKITTSGAISEYPLPSGAAPRGITTGPDGALWFGDDGNNAIGRIPTSGQPVSEYTIPTTGAAPIGITAGNDGAIWFTEWQGGNIGRLIPTAATPNTPNGITEFTPPTTPTAAPLGITQGTDGNMWFTEGAGNIGCIAPAATCPGSNGNAIVEYPTGQTGTDPYGIATGPDGNVWFADWGSGKVGTIGLGAYTLTDTNGYIQTLAPSGPGVYQATKETSPASGKSTATETTTYQSVSVPSGTGTTTISEPVQILSAAPGATCAATPAQQAGPPAQQGCRDLVFTYASETTFTPQPDCPNGWGDSPGLLKTATFYGYDVNAGSFTTNGLKVARYCYDSNGLLRGEFDPRISPSLVTQYGYDSNNRVTTVTPPGLAAWTINYGTIPSDPTPGRLLSVSRQDPANGTAISTMAYHVPLSGTGAPYAMGNSDVATWGQQDDPIDATAIFPPDEVPGSPPSDYNRATIYYLDTFNREVNVAQPGGRITTTEYDTSTKLGPAPVNPQDNVTRELTAASRAEALTYGSQSSAQSTLLDTESNYSADGINLGSRIGPQHMMQLTGGSQVVARNETTYTYGSPPPNCGTTTKPCLNNQLKSQTEESSYELSDPRTTAYDYSGQNNLGWQLGRPTSVTTDSGTGRLNLVKTTLYDPTTGNVTETRQPANPGGGDAHATQAIYFTTGANSSAASCGYQPAWAGQVCQTQPAAQPGTAGLPALPQTNFTYDLWGDTLTTTDTIPGTTPTASRTITNTYVGDRVASTSVAVSNSPSTASVPAVTYGYDPNTGLPTTQSAGAQTITTGYDTLGRTTSYIDANGNTSSSSYDVDGRLSTLNDGKGTQTSTYDSTTGDLKQVQDSAAGTFTATYNPNGQLATEGYPNGMTATYTYDESGSPTDLKYTAPSGCASNCTWFDDSVISSAHGQWIAQASTLSSQNYTYDGAGRLTQVQDIPAGAGCTTRIYAYDADSNRQSSKSVAPGTGGICTSTGGTSATHTYDAADRLTDTGVTYESFGNTTTLPAADAGGTPLVSTYYATNQIQSQLQGGQTISYTLDPARRVSGRQYTGTNNSTTIDHYSDGSDSPTWTDNGSGSWTRYGDGVDGNLAATQTSGGSITLHLTNLHGDVIGTVNDSPTATPTLSQNSDEFGVPYTGKTPQRYDYLGTKQRTTALPTGVTDMGAREYVPSLGRFEQPDPITGGSANSYDYANQDPVTEVDLLGEATGVTCRIKSFGTPQPSSQVALSPDITLRVSIKCTLGRAVSRTDVAFAVGSLCLQYGHGYPARGLMGALGPYDGGWGALGDSCSPFNQDWVTSGPKTFTVRTSGACKAGRFRYRGRLELADGLVFEPNIPDAFDGPGPASGVISCRR
jgi:RHS repeat-associated protein